MSNLEKNKIWVEANKIAEKAYSAVDELPRSEEFNTTRKIQSSANDLIFYVAQAVGGSAEFDWSYAQRSLAGLMTMYRFAGRQKFIKLDPEFMVQMHKLEELIDKEIKMASKAEKQKQEDEIKHWQKKYKLWKENENED